VLAEHSNEYNVEYAAEISGNQVHIEEMQS
jgi:DNA-dependent RNA polymerase auxiliary subunit epsilon